MPDSHVAQYYSYLTDVTIMVFIGFGFLMTYLKDYALSAITLNMGLSAMMMAGAIIFMGFEENGFGQFEVDLPLLINSAFCAAAGMITFGAVIGFASPVQALWLLAFEVPLYAANVYLTVYKIGAFDVGGSITIHAFGAFFGLAASTFITRSSKTLGSQHHKNASSPASDLTSMIGTLFLWVYWPSFNAALASSGPDVETQAHHQFYVVPNTLLTLLGATLAAFVASPFLKGGLCMVHVQNATLAGGVAIGAAAALRIPPAAALGLGLLAGTVSTFGFQYSTSFIERTLSLSDTFGVQNLHGIPGVLGALASAVLVAIYGGGNADILSRSGTEQAVLQIAGLAATLAVAIVGGLVAGWLVTTVEVPGLADTVKREEFDDDAVIKRQ